MSFGHGFNNKYIKKKENALFIEPLHILHDVILLPSFGEINTAFRKKIRVADVNERKILENQASEKYSPRH